MICKNCWCAVASKTERKRKPCADLLANDHDAWYPWGFSLWPWVQICTVWFLDLSMFDAFGSVITWRSKFRLVHSMSIGIWQHWWTDITVSKTGKHKRVQQSWKWDIHFLDVNSCWWTWCWPCTCSNTVHSSFFNLRNYRSFICAIDLTMFTLLWQPGADRVIIYGE